jgi:O-antigen/teichoic acid export membrane protein
MDQAKTLTSGTFYLALMNATQYAMSFVFYVIVARVLSPSEVGSFSLLLMIMAVFNTLTLLALNNAVIKYVSESLGREDEKGAWACSRKALKLMLSVAVPALGACLLASPMLSSYVGAGSLEVSAMLASAFVLDLTSYYGAIMYGYCMFKHVSAQNILYTLSTRFLGFLLAFLGLKVLGLSLGFLMGSLAALAYSLLVLRGKIGSSKEDFPSSKLLRFSMPIYGANAIGLLQSWLDVAILSSIVGLSATGTYYIAIASVAPLSILWVPLSSALFPTLSWMNGSGDRGQVLEVCKRALRFATAIVLPLSVALASVSETALSIAYGRVYAEASAPFAILAFSSILSAYASIYSAELQALGRTRPMFIAGVASIVAYTFLLATITKPLGQAGAALARATMIAVGFLVLYRETSVKLPSNLNRGLVVAAVFALALAPIERFVRVNLHLKALTEVSVFIIVALLTFKLVKPLDDYEIELLKSSVLLRPRAFKSTQGQTKRS